MAKRRNKNKARRALVGLNRNIDLNEQDANISDDVKSIYVENAGDDEDTIDDPPVLVQTTDMDDVPGSENIVDTNTVTDFEVATDLNKKPKKVAKRKTMRSPKSDNDGNGGDEIAIFPTERDGETCIDIQCGPNEAIMYLDKLCVGSRGACVLFDGSWLTPNEFQAVSGRETAKDWKRSIRHRGKSLKLLISKGLVFVQPSSPKKPRKSTNGSPPSAVGGVSVAEEKKAKKLKATPQVPVSPPRTEPDVTTGNDDKEARQAVQISPVTPSQEIPQPKKRGRKPKRHRGRKPADGGDRQKAPPDVHHLTSFTARVGRERAGGSVDGETEDAAERSGGSDAETAEVDTRTDEERRLDEFVHSLRLTKTSAVAKSQPAVTSTEIVDPEMPVLQKETVATGNYERLEADISVSVDALNATVTPPPTPPSERINVNLDKKPANLDDAVVMETFKSTLASPSVGLKLTINREKRDLVSPHDVKPVIKSEEKEAVEVAPIKKELSESKVNMQTLLLQDALQSARKYKESLQQGRQVSPCKLPPPVSPKLSPKVEQLDKKPLTSPLQPHPVKAEPGVDKKTGNRVAPTVAVLDKNAFPSLCAGKVPSMADMRKLSAMSFKDFMTVMASVYGPLPFPSGSKDMAFAVLKDLQQKHDMLRLLTQEDGANGPAAEQAALLYPMITQQLLFAVTQQLYSMCNMQDPRSQPPSQAPVRNGYRAAHQKHANISAPTAFQAVNSHTQSVEKNRNSFYGNNLSPRSNETVLYEQAQKRLSDSGCKTQFESQRRTMTTDHYSPSVQANGAGLKRKHIEVDQSGALDLSMKKPRTDNRPCDPVRSGSSDGPIDFSVKTDHSRLENSYPGKAGIRGLESRVTHSVHPGVLPYIPTYSVASADHFRQPKVSMAACTCRRRIPITAWNVDHVCEFLRSVEGCSPYIKTFRDQGINGRVLPYLTSQHLTRTLSMKVGPALTLIQAIERHVTAAMTSSTLLTSPCTCGSLRNNYTALTAQAHF